MKTIIKTIGCVFLILLFLTACGGPDIRDPENFRYLEGTVIHYYHRILIVKPDDGQKINFRVGRHTVFKPYKELPSIGDRVRVRYLIKPYSSWKVGDYFIAYEVSKIKD